MIPEIEIGRQISLLLSHLLGPKWEKIGIDSYIDRSKEIHKDMPEGIERIEDGGDRLTWVW